MRSAKDPLVLINPPSHQLNPSPPTGLLCLASHAKQYGYRPVIIDFNVLFRRDKYPSDYFLQAAKKILARRPWIIGFGVMCNNFPVALLIANKCKELAPHIPIIFGGPDVFMEDIPAMRFFKQIDIIVRGEGEITLVETLNALKNNQPLTNILGITFREKGRIQRNPDRPFINNLDRLPYLDFSLLPKTKSYRIDTIEAGRGCPFKCTFCSSRKMWRGIFRIKSARRLVRELKQIHSLSGKRKDSCLNLSHDNFLASRKTVEKFFSLIAGQKISWACTSRLDLLDAALIKKLKRAGCREIVLGIESASPKIQKEIKKNLPLSKLPRTLNLLQQNGLRVCLSFIIGFPNEKKPQINQTLRMALKSKLSGPSVNVQIHLLTILKGSELYFKKSFVLSKFMQTTMSPPITNLREELSLIKKHPHIFPSFFQIKNNSVNLELLQKTYILFRFLIHFFPLTTLLLLKHLATSPLQLGKKMIAYFNKAGINWVVLSEEKSLFNHYFPYLRGFTRKISTPLIKQAFTHEELFQKSSFMKNCAPQRSLKVNLRSLPILAKCVKIKEYSYDLSNLGEKLKTRKIKRFIAYVPGETAKAVSLGPLTHRLLLFCDGRMTLRDIFSQNVKKEILGKRGKKILLEKFRLLQKMGIIE